MNSWPTNARVGQKIVCVHAAPDIGKDFRKAERLLVGAVYTIKELFLVDTILCFELIEVRRDWTPNPYNNDYRGYGAFRFKPLHDTTQQVADLIRQCLPAPAKELVE